ncbi:MAG: hypothetical protein VX822_00750 [Candidatus Neomarinimicrobiota bacterium]|nr:hypothetical protein [Candidatus Neomarinimicrobiota bacterium]
MTRGCRGRTFLATLMALWVAAMPFFHITHDLENHLWSPTTTPGFCEDQCDTSEHKVTNFQRDCFHVRIRDYVLIEIDDIPFFVSVDTFLPELSVPIINESVSLFPPSRAPPLA